MLLLLHCHLLIIALSPSICRVTCVTCVVPSVLCWHETREAARVQSDCWNGTLTNMTLTFPRTNDSHRNARNYRIDSQTPENTSHFAMRITLFSSLNNTPNGDHKCQVQLSLNVRRIRSRPTRSIQVWLSGLRLYLQSDRDKTLHCLGHHRL